MRTAAVAAKNNVLSGRGYKTGITGSCSQVDLPVPDNAQPEGSPTRRWRLRKTPQVRVGGAIRKDCQNIALWRCSHRRALLGWGRRVEHHVAIHSKHKASEGLRQCARRALTRIGALPSPCVAMSS